MITVTPQAAKQIRIAAEQSDATGLSLRIATKKLEDGSFDYGMGFDNVTDDDMVFEQNGVSIAFAPEFGPSLNGTAIDFVEMNPGDYRFIFLNPNDPHFVPPKEEEAAGGGCCSS